ncbi:hypothetical protein RIR_jg18108.t1 [Rhizophagus irregularis DAOM 181602=DAOM 197198]|uniref:Uncharacterized protein n=1 Tax=Rhizophagus irregularis (strain DAOM 181602 / DAOM 197198 / MUCL 43194) TaxID=747089 RepID=U9SL01_RHIID|nr:hypothetical protein RIR_jg18108.t1 [Rhizophagus irregularis DAOM 181602=DAOM 197198]
MEDNCRLPPYSLENKTEFPNTQTELLNRLKLSRKTKLKSFYFVTSTTNLTPWDLHMPLIINSFTIRISLIVSPVTLLPTNLYPHIFILIIMSQIFQNQLYLAFSGL